MEPCINIYDLNLDVLSIIFSKLEFEDQINFGLAHPYLGECFLIRNSKRFREFDLNKFPERIWDSLLSLCGPTLESLCCHQNTLPVLKCAIKHCKSLKKINFSVGYESVSSFDELRCSLCEFKNLNCITIRNDCLLYYDEYIKFITTVQSWEELPNLRILKLDDFPRGAFNSIKELDQLEELNIDTSKEHDIGYICATLKTLRILIHHRRRIPKNYKKFFHPCNSHLAEEIIICNRKIFAELNIDEFHEIIWDSLIFLCGPIVKSLNFQKNSLRPFDCAAKYCKSLQNIKFVVGFQYSLAELSRKLFEFKNVNSITIRNDRDNDEDSELARLIQSLQELPNLRKLAVIDFPSNALIALRELTQLEELDIAIPRTREGDIGYICATLKNLRVLISKGNITEDSLQAVAESCPLLEKLELYPGGVTQLPHFPKLKELMVEVWVPQCLNDILSGLGHLYAQQLDKLTIYTPFPEIYEHDELVEKFRGVKNFKTRTEILALLNMIL